MDDSVDVEHSPPARVGRNGGLPGLRTVTLPTVAAEALAEHLSTYAEAGPEGLVFPAERGGPIRRSNFTRRVWIPATWVARTGQQRRKDDRR